MKIPKYWAKGPADCNLEVRNIATGKVIGLYSCWGWSDVSVEDARAKGVIRANAVMERVQQGNPPDRYHYSDCPVREEVLDEWQREDGSIYAAITLNSYGCNILNTEDIAFVDVDFNMQPPWWGLVPFLKSLFRPGDASYIEKQEVAALALLNELIALHPECGVRAYRTKAGLRYIITHDRTQPENEHTLKMMDALGADPLYVRLCKLQQSFRARLSPKPWRCGIGEIRVQYPWKDKAAENEVRSWIKVYETRTGNFSTCRFLNHYGNIVMDEEMSRVVAFHDERTRAHVDLKLA